MQPIVYQDDAQAAARQALQARVLACADNPDTADVDQLALDVFAYQARYCAVYAEFLRHLRIVPEQVNDASAIPYLPIGLFKTRTVTSLPAAMPQRVFASSRTTGQVPSRHLVYELGWYHRVARYGFSLLAGSFNDRTFLSLLPSYNQAGESSLVEMVHDFKGVRRSNGSGQAADTPQGLQRQVDAILTEGRTPALFGVTHALLRMVEQGQVQGKVDIYETGGMKGRGPELTRAELQARLRKGFPQARIFSEYGMTELTSQAYTLEDGGETFTTPPWLRMSLADPRDPLSAAPGNRGQLRLADLANLDSCAFIASQDMAERRPGGYAILGRVDNSEIRGCNLLEV